MNIIAIIKSPLFLLAFVMFYIDGTPDQAKLARIRIGHLYVKSRHTKIIPLNLCNLHSMRTRQREKCSKMLHYLYKKKKRENRLKYPKKSKHAMTLRNRPEKQSDGCTIL